MSPLEIEPKLEATLAALLAETAAQAAPIQPLSRPQTKEFDCTNADDLTFDSTGHHGDSTDCADNSTSCNSAYTDTKFR